ncbi:MAG: sensor histidine kinase [Chloroflexota bacterium]
MIRKLFSRLWFRLLLATMGCAGVAILTVAVLANEVVVGPVGSFLQQDVQQRDARLVAILARYHQERGSWEGVPDTVQRLATLVGDRLVVAGENGRVVADSGNRLVGQPASRSWRRAMPVSNGRTEVGKLYVNPTLAGRAESNRDRLFLSGLNHALLLSSLLAAAFSLLISLLLARTLVRPLGSMVAAARRMGQGDLGLRVAGRGGGELGELAGAINHMAEDLQRNLEARRQMIADVAHELRTPLQNINGYLEAIKDGLVAPDPSTIEVLSSETQALRRLVEDLQELSLADAGALRMELGPVDLAEQARGVVESVRPRAEEMGIDLSMDLPDDLPEVRADSRRLRQIVGNLVGNALKYTPRGGRVWLSARPSAGGVVLTVSDTGVGLSPADQARVFERFFRVDRARARATGGAGLGLAITRELVRAMEGTIQVRSQEGHGSHFDLWLPADGPAGDGSPAHRQRFGFPRPRGRAMLPTHAGATHYPG